MQEFYVIYSILKIIYATSKKFQINCISKTWIIENLNGILVDRVLKLWIKKNCNKFSWFTCIILVWNKNIHAICIKELFLAIESSSIWIKSKWKSSTFRLWKSNLKIQWISIIWNLKKKNSIFCLNRIFPRP